MMYWIVFALFSFIELFADILISWQVIVELVHDLCRLLRCIQSDVTELNRYGFVFDERTDGQAVMHCSRHRLTVSVVYVITLTYTSTNDQWVCPAFPLGSSSKSKPYQFSSAEFSYVAVCVPLVSLSGIFMCDSRYCYSAS